MKRSYHLFFSLLLAIGVFLIGSLIILAQDNTGNDGQIDSDTVLIDRGYEVFVASGCIACHGMNAEGNDIGPALAGHSEFAVRRQVRGPTNIMLVFSPAQIPEEDLEALVAYISSLEMNPEGESGHMEHDMSGITPGDLVFAHHWFLWLELEAGDVEGSIHHTAHILELLTDGPHKAMMQPVLTALGDGDLDTARAIVEPMVTDVGEFSHDVYTVGMQLTYQALSNSDLESANHFATDLSEHDISEDQLATVNDVLALIETCELDNAMMSIDMALSGDVTFLPSDMAMDMDMSDDHSEDGDIDMDDDHSDDAEMDMDDDHSDDAEMDMDDDHSDDAEMDMDDDHSDDAEMDMDDDHSDDSDDHSDDADDHDEMDTTGCGEHDDDMDMTTEEHDD